MIAKALRPNGRFCGLVLALAAGCLLLSSAAQESKEKKDPPKVLLANPFILLPGQTKKVILRGLKLDTATEVKVNNSAAMAKFISAAKSAAPNQQNPQRVGDTQVEVEISLPAEVGAAGKLEISLVTPAGESAPYSLTIGGEFPVIEEQEPNDGFKQAQAVMLPQIIVGSIHGNQNVDVFSVEPPAGQKLVVEMMAAGAGSALDALLTIYDAKGTILATCDDVGTSQDARLELVAPGGKLFLSLQDANDQGGTAFPYQLLVKTMP